MNMDWLWPQKARYKSNKGNRYQCMDMNTKHRTGGTNIDMHTEIHQSMLRHVYFWFMLGTL